MSLNASVTYQPVFITSHWTVLRTLGTKLFGVNVSDELVGSLAHKHLFARFFFFREKRISMKKVGVQVSKSRLQEEKVFIP